MKNAFLDLGWGEMGSSNNFLTGGEGNDISTEIKLSTWHPTLREIRYRYTPLYGNTYLLVCVTKYPAISRPKLSISSYFIVFSLDWVGLDWNIGWEDMLLVGGALRLLTPWEAYP